MSEVHDTVVNDTVVNDTVVNDTAVTDAQIAALSRDRIAPELLESGQHVIVDVWGPQCQPCLALGPTYERLAAGHGDRARFLKLEAPKNRMACVDLKVHALPTFLHYAGGREVSRLTGEVSADELETWVTEAITSEE
jgi:thioredoxin